MGGHSGRLWGMRERLRKEEDTHETEAIEDSFNDACSKGRAAEGREVPWYGDMAFDERIVVDDHVCGEGEKEARKKRRYMHSSSFSTLFSIASAGLPKTARHTCVWMDMSAGTRRISRLGFFEEDSARQAMSSRTRIPTR